MQILKVFLYWKVMESNFGDESVCADDKFSKPLKSYLS